MTLLNRLYGNHLGGVKVYKENVVSCLMAVSDKGTNYTFNLMFNSEECTSDIFENKD